MALKDILVHLDASEGSIPRLRLAMDLAHRQGSRLSALFVDEWSLAQRESRATAEMGLAAALDLDQLDRAITADIERSATRLRTLLATFGHDYGLEFEWARSAGSSDVALGRQVPYCDLCVVGHESLITGTSVDRDFCERLFFTSVTPILLVPTQSKVTSLGRRIVVAWDSSRTAGRALNDSICLIERAEQATVIYVDTGLHANNTTGLELLQQRLRRHNTRVSVVRVQAPEESIATAIQAKAHELHADLLVAGAFGHSRLKERIFGGVSRELLHNMTLPVLMSH